MKRGFINKLVDSLTVGNRPLRIFVFGGVLAAYVTMHLLGLIFAIDTDVGADIDLANTIIMTLSILIGFATSYGFMRLLENYKHKCTDEKSEET